MVENDLFSSKNKVFTGYYNFLSKNGKRIRFLASKMYKPWKFHRNWSTLSNKICQNFPLFRILNKNTNLLQKKAIRFVLWWNLLNKTEKNCDFPYKNLRWSLDSKFNSRNFILGKILQQIFELNRTSWTR
jgi:hypothetical protein